MSLARILTIVFNPLTWPMLLFSVLFWVSPGLVPTVVNKGVLWLLIASGSFLVPAFMILTLRNAGLISSIQMDQKEDRKFPMLITVIIYFALTWMLFQKTPKIVHWTFLGIACVLLILSLITVFWKISAHSLAASGCAFFVTFLGINNQIPELVYFGLGLIILAGFVSWARLRLEAHSTGQVWGGLFFGFISSFGVLLMP
jgi:hypothetical protein